jgi:hypothetical protein
MDHADVDPRVTYLYSRAGLLFDAQHALLLDNDNVNDVVSGTTITITTTYYCTNLAIELVLAQMV